MCIRDSCRAVYNNDVENMLEFRVDFPDFSGDYCLTITLKQGHGDGKFLHQCRPCGGDVYKRQVLHQPQYVTDLPIFSQESWKPPV